MSPASRRHPSPSKPPPGRYAWARSGDERLLGLRPRDLGLRLRGSWIEDCLAQVHRELDSRGLRYRPHVWLSSEWFSPEGSGGIAVPFVLAHPRLIRLERRIMLEAEGDTREECLRILRHEMGHAYDTAYRLNRRRAWRRAFGRTSQRYPEVYRPDPASRHFVQHLRLYYAQAHPDEDFAETFAVWLTPDSPWRKRYHGWPALKKLEYVDALMGEIGALQPRVTTRYKLDPIGRLRKTLREHYETKRQRYGVDYPDVYDRDLRRLFSDAPEYRGNPSAVQFIRRIRKEVRTRIALWTGEYQYTINQVIDEIDKRCRELSLRLAVSEEQARLDFTVFIAVQTMHYLHSGQHRVWL